MWRKEHAGAGVHVSYNFSLKCCPIFLSLFAVEEVKDCGETFDMYIRRKRELYDAKCRQQKIET